ncbi:MAG: condensation domain-containing protein, partial [Blastocatellia bacterium]
MDDLCWQYGDFSIWQREWLKGDEYKSQLSYWKKALQDVPAILDLPTDRQRPAIQTYSGTFQLFRLQDDTYRLLKETVKTRGATVFMVLMAVFQSLLHRYTGNDALLIAVPTANRNVRGVEGLIGFFANTLAIRADLSDRPTFDDLLARVKETAISAYMNQNIPFQKLVEELQPNRDARYSTFLQVSFMVQTEVISAFRMPGLEVQFAHANEYAVRFDLGFSALDQPGAGLTARLEYNTDLFDTDTIDRMLSHFQVLAHSALERPGRKLADLAFLSDAEKHHLTREWSDTETERGTSGFVPSLFEGQSSNTPDRIVLAMDGSAITYSKLNRRSNQLACYLRRMGVSTESLIGVLMDRSIDMV